MSRVLVVTERNRNTATDNDTLAVTDLAVTSPTSDNNNNRKHRYDSRCPIQEAQTKER